MICARIALVWALCAPQLGRTATAPESAADTSVEKSVVLPDAPREKLGRGRILGRGVSAVESDIELPFSIALRCVIFTACATALLAKNGSVRRR